MTTILGILMGLGLSVATGFRVFVPFLGLSIAARLGYVPLSADFAWLATTPALIALGTATILEIAAYFIPWLDNAMDAIATPAAVVAGVVIMASVGTDLPPVARWGLAIIAGGGAAGAVQGATALTRLKSTVVSGGLANPLVALVELAGSVVTTIVALAAPALFLVVFLLIGVPVALYLFFRRSPAPVRQ